VNSLEDKVRSATRAQAQTLREVRPLRLTPDPADTRKRPSRLGRPARARLSRGWLGPAAVAVLVVAIAIALVVVRDIPRGRMAPAPPSVAQAYAGVGVPTYYVTAYQPSGSSLNSLVIGRTLTGVRLATIAPPPHTRWVGVTGAADDRTFVVTALPVSRGLQLMQPVTWYLLRITPGHRPGYQLTRFAIPNLRSWDVEGIALSGSGHELAVTLLSAAQELNPAGGVLRIYSVASGKLLRNWSTNDSNLTIYGSYPGVQTPGLSWTDGDQAVVFPTFTLSSGLPKNAPLETLRLIEATAKSGSLLAASRLFWAMPRTAGPRAPAGCNAGIALATLDEKTVVCVTRPMWNGNNAQDRATFAWLAYSLSAPTVARFLYQVTVHGPLSHFGAGDVLWTSGSGSSVIIEWDEGAPPEPEARISVLRDGKFAGLLPPLPGDIWGYTYPVAW
jgi:hypothetical protein